MRDNLLTPVPGGHVFRGTWEALAELETATCDACGEHIKQDGEPAEVVEHDGAGASHRIMCGGWSPDVGPGVLRDLARGMVREREAPDDVGDLLPSRPSHEAQAELYSAHWDASQPQADVRASLFRIGKAFDALSTALSDEEHALRMALEHDERSSVVSSAPPEQAPAELTPERLDELDRRARGAAERASRATAGPWERLGGSGNASALVSTVDKDGPDLAEVFGPHEPPNANADFIAHAREDVPALSAAVLALSAEVRRLWKRDVAWQRATHVGDPVSCCREDETPDRAEMIRRANEALRALASGEPPRAGEEQKDG